MDANTAALLTQSVEDYKSLILQSAKAATAEMMQTEIEEEARRLAVFEMEYKWNMWEAFGPDAIEGGDAEIEASIRQAFLTRDEAELGRIFMKLAENYVMEDCTKQVKENWGLA